MRSRGSFLFVAGSLSWAIAQWFLVWLFARFAGGAAAVGEYSLALAVTTPIFIVGQFGLRTIYLTFRRRHPWPVYLKLRFAGIALSVAVTIGYFVFTAAGDPWIWGALVFQKSVDAYLDLLYGRIQRENRLWQIGLLGLSKTLGTMLVSAAVVLSTQSISLAVIGAGIVSAIVTVFARRIGSNSKEHTVAPRSSSGYREILRAATPITATEGLTSVSNYLPLLFLGVIADDAVAGTFAAASYLFSVAHIIGGILRNVLVTSLRLTYEDEGLGRLLFNSHRIAVSLGLIGLLAVPVVIFAGSPVLEFLYGAGFAFTYGELALLASAALSIAPSYIYSALLNIVNRYDSQAWSLLGAVFLGAGAGFLLALMPEVPALVVALGVAFAVNWGRFLGVLALTLTVRFRK